MLNFLVYFLLIFLFLPISGIRGSLLYDPSQSLSTYGSIHRLCTALEEALQAEGLGLSGGSLNFTASLKRTVFSGNNSTVVYPLSVRDHYIKINLLGSTLGILMRNLRCDVGWGEGCGGVDFPLYGAGTASKESSIDSSFIRSFDGLVDDVLATHRIRIALWARRMEFCELADFFAPGALVVLGPTKPTAPVTPSELLHRGLRSEFIGFLGSFSTLGSCVLRRLRNGGGRLAGIITHDGSTMHTTQEALLHSLLGGNISDIVDSQQRESPCTLLSRFRSSVVKFVARKGDAAEDGVALVPAPSLLPSAQPLKGSPSLSRLPSRASDTAGLHVFTSLDTFLEDVLTSDNERAPSIEDSWSAWQSPDATSSPSPPPTPPPQTLWHALLVDLQELRKLSASSIENEGYFSAHLKITRSGNEEVNNGAVYDDLVPAWLPSCTQDSEIRLMLDTLVTHCAHSPPPEPSLADSLARETGRLLLAVLLAGDGEKFDVTRCLLHFHRNAAGLSEEGVASASQHAVPNNNYDSTPLFLCLPTSPLAPVLCPPSTVWASPRSQLVPYWNDISSTSATLLLTHPRVSSFLRTLLHYSLAVGDIAGWHPSGISPPESPDLTFSPQHMFYFASSYFFVHLEKEYKKQLHRRLNAALSRLKFYPNTQHILVDATAWRKGLRVFNFQRDALAAVTALQGLMAGKNASDISAALANVRNSFVSPSSPLTQPYNYIFPDIQLLAPTCKEPDTPRLLVFSSYWDRGHSSHRITAPLSKSLTHYTCAYLAHAVSQEVWEATREGESLDPGNAGWDNFPDKRAAFNATRYAELMAGARNRYEDPGGFTDVEIFPVTESLSIQLALWSHFRSPWQVSGQGVPSVDLYPGNARVDETFLLDMSEWEESDVMQSKRRTTTKSDNNKGDDNSPKTTPLQTVAHQLEYPFDAVLYPSVGMSPNDMTLSSLRVAPTQMVTYGHSSSSQSPVMDIFLGGVEPEVLGPLTSDIYATELSCGATLQALYNLLSVSLKEPRLVAKNSSSSNNNDNEVSDGPGLIGGTEPSSPLRLPMVSVCSGAAILLRSDGNARDSGGSSSGGGGGPEGNASQVVCILYDKYLVSSAGPLGAGSLNSLVNALLPPGSPPPSSRCKSSFPMDQPVAHALYTRLIDAQRRYSERLLLLPGLGLWFTHVFPSYAPPLRKMPTLASIPQARRALHFGAGILGYMLGGRTGAVDGSREARGALREAVRESPPPPPRADAAAPVVGAQELVDSLLAILNVSLSSVPWPGSTPSDPIEISLVWSVVKWNGRHLDRLLISMHTAQVLWATAWNKCMAVKDSCTGGGMGGSDTQYTSTLPGEMMARGMKWWQRSGSGGGNAVTEDMDDDDDDDDDAMRQGNSTPAFLAPAAAAAATCAICRKMLEAFPARTPTLAPPLFFRIVSFSTSDGDAMKGAAFRAWVRRTLATEFPGGTVSSLFITNATTPGNYYGRLGLTHLAFDSLPFSACNTMQDVVALRVPTVSAAHDGEFEPGSGTPLRWRSSIGASMLTRLGLSGLAAEGEEELIGKASHLIANPLLRAAWKLRMDRADEGELARKEYADRDAQLVAQMLRRRKAEREHMM